MKFILIGLALIVGVSSQIHTKSHEDGYHYDKPNIDVRLVLPSETTKAPLPVKPEPKVVAPTLPPLPAFIPQINLPKVIPIKPASQPLPVKPASQPLPVKPASQPLPVKPAIKVETEALALPPLPSFIPQINLPKIIPVKPAPLPVKPEVSKPAPFAPRVDPTREYLPPDQWEEWKKKYNKRYASDEEDKKRKAIFEDNVDFINSRNNDFGSGKSTFECSANEFADLTSEEFIKQRTGLRLKKRALPPPVYLYDAPYGSERSSGSGGSGSGSGSSSFGGSGRSSFGGSSGSGSGSGSSSFSGSGRSSFGSGSSDFGGSSDGFGSSNSTSRFGSSSDSSSSSGNNEGQDIPEGDEKDEVDWRKEGCITPVKNQGNCASCWAFAANGALEAYNFLKKKTGPIPLSEQNLVDCVTDNDGCDGGYMTNAFHYVAKNPGVDKESTYPYEKKQSKCRFDPANVGGECKSHKEIPLGNEKAMIQVVAKVGPVAAGIDGGQRSFQFYKSGYYFEPKCDQEVNHAVLIVGYGKTDAGEEYWICKNSWDTDWGEEGYIRMAKNKNNHCGIANLASYPIV